MIDQGRGRVEALLTQRQKRHHGVFHLSFMQQALQILMRPGVKTSQFELCRGFGPQRGQLEDLGTYLPGTEAGGRRRNKWLLYPSGHKKSSMLPL
jgi:hypothetical protein